MDSNKTYKISLGNSRKCKVWSMEEWTWNRFVDRVKDFSIGDCTQEEWRGLSTDQKSDKKDVGGFICGELSSGNRSRVLSRSMICLDADFAAAEFLDIVELCFGYKCVVYSTRSHDTEKSKYRYRVIVPLASDIKVSEYGAACQWAIDMIGAEYFDKTSIQPGRLMYWPSCNIGMDVEVLEVDGETLDFNKIKVTSGKGSVSSSIGNVDLSNVDNGRDEYNKVKQADPLEKAGLIGIFCRTYNIYEAISEFLQDVYIAGNDGRYTYTGGTSTNGLIVYDSKFAYSHHESDPCSMILCNSYDLVRIHKFGNSKNSIKNMNSYILSLPCIKSQWQKEKNRELFKDFHDGQDSDITKFVEELDYDDKGHIKNTMKNARILLSKFVKIRSNELWEKGVIEISGGPWMKPGETRCMEDGDYFFMYELLEKYGIKKLCIDEAIKGLAQINSYNPVCDMLSGLEGTWDGVPRAETLFIDCLGVEDSEYTRYVTKMWLAGCVQRMRNPGCQFDYMIVLDGQTGYRKSTLCSTLASGYFCNTISLADTKDHKKAVEKIKNNWIVEFSELDGIRKTDEETIKNFITTRVDTYRPVWGRSVLNVPRRCVFIGTSNNPDYLRDVTGNRRFIPLSVTKKWDGELDVAQVWAEVLTFADTQLLYMPVEIEELAERKQEMHLDVSEEKLGLVEEFLNMRLPENWDSISQYEKHSFILNYNTMPEIEKLKCVPRVQVCSLDIWTELFNKSRSDIDKNSTREVTRILKRLGWKEIGTKKTIFGKQRVWKKNPKIVSNNFHDRIESVLL